MSRRHSISMEEGVQSRSVTPSVQRRYIISTDEGVHYESIISSLLTRVYSTVLPKLLRGVITYLGK